MDTPPQRVCGGGGAQPSADSICKSAATPSRRYKASIRDVEGKRGSERNANTTLFFITFNNVIMCDMDMEVNPWHVNERDSKSDLHFNMRLLMMMIIT